MIAALLGAVVAVAGAAPGPTPVCGDGVIAVPETCDDEGAEAGDGCDADCLVEDGWTCTGEPSDCAGICGDGLRRDAEECDDAGTVAGDGCSEACVTEDGYECSTGDPSVCTLGAICGNGVVEGGEVCDDDDTEAEDGCDGTCTQEPGFLCEHAAGQPSTCVADDDDDAIANELDNCPQAANPSQRDEDDDGVGDKCEQVVDEDGCSAAGGDGGGLASVAIVLLLTLRTRRFVT